MATAKIGGRYSEEKMRPIAMDDIMTIFLVIVSLAATNQNSLFRSRPVARGFNPAGNGRRPFLKVPDFEVAEGHLATEEREIEKNVMKNLKKNYNFDHRPGSNPGRTSGSQSP